MTRAPSTARAIVVLTATWAILAVSAAPAPAATITAAAANPSATSCSPFGRGTGWTPYMGFSYKNLPPFTLKPGDSIAFDLGTANDVAVGLEVGMAPAIANGGSFGAVPVSNFFTRIVSNTQVPATPLGNDLIGDYELRFGAEAVFNFAGGGLLIRFSNPSPALAADATCGNGLAAGGATADPGGFLHSSFSGDPDGVFPWANPSLADIAQFRLTLADAPPPGGGEILAAQKRGCKKKAKVKRGKPRKRRCGRKKGSRG